MKSPFPYFGGKMKIAAEVWRRLGNPPNFVEPFFGSGAVLLARPHLSGIETVNDVDCFIANFWRALQAAPKEMAQWASYPVNEADLHARHLWLVNQVEWRERMKIDPDHYDAKIAGRWVWGISQWIGAGWCGRTSQTNDGGRKRQRPHLGDAGVGVHRKLPNLGTGGRGVHRQLPHLGRGEGVHRQLPHLGDGWKGRCTERTEALIAYFQALADRLRDVRVCCGDWKRVMGPAPTFANGLTGIFLDPPYASERAEVYSEDRKNVAREVGEWCLANGGNRLLRIALCGYEGEHDLPGWHQFNWKAHGGYGVQGNGKGRENAKRECVWFSPHCLNLTLFSSGVGDQ